MVRWARERKAEGARLGFIPTMGALHEGHRSLIRAARTDCDAVAVSIFVNPLQFGPQEDLARYPRSLQEDLRLCRAEEVAVVFVPNARELYSKEFQTIVTVEQLTQSFEGRSRPGHFQGVTTVVLKLLNIVQPDQTFFGQKDYQQALVIRQMAKDLNLPIRVTIRPTVREPDNLALSSRNRFLSPQERRAATVLFRALSSGRALIRRGERDTETIRDAMVRMIQSEPLARLDYAAVVAADTLDELKTMDRPAVLLIATWIGRTRLIDNMIVPCR
jgi:pantoate--beta-alanine ligase